MKLKLLWWCDSWYMGHTCRSQIWVQAGHAFCLTHWVPTWLFLLLLIFSKKAFYHIQASGTPQQIYFLKAYDVSYPNSDENTYMKTKTIQRKWQRQRHQENNWNNNSVLNIRNSDDSSILNNNQQWATTNNKQQTSTNKRQRQMTNNIKP